MTYCSTGLLIIFPNADHELVTYLIEEQDHNRVVLNDPGGKIDPIDKGDPIKTTEREFYEEACMRISLKDPLACIDISDRGRVVHKLYLAYHPTILITPTEFQSIMSIRKEIFQHTQTLKHVKKIDYLKSRQLRIVKLSDLLDNNQKFSARLNRLVKNQKFHSVVEQLIIRYTKSLKAPKSPKFLNAQHTQKSQKSHKSPKLLSHALRKPPNITV